MTMRTVITACLLSLLLTLPGCGTPNTAPALEVALTAADQSAISYVTLPACPRPAGTLCSDTVVVGQIKAAAGAAYAAVKAYQKGTGTMAVAQAAIAAMVALIPPTTR